MLRQSIIRHARNTFTRGPRTSDQNRFGRISVGNFAISDGWSTLRPAARP
jgi:hypothetical protein